MESELKELLREQADDARIDATIPAEVARRASARRKRNVALSALVTAAVVAASVVTIRAIVDVEPPPRPGAAGGWPGIWPQETRAEAEDAQEAVEASDERFNCAGDSADACLEHEFLWQLDAEQVALRFAVESLGWPAASVSNSDMSIEANTVGPVSFSIDSCAPARIGPCRPDVRGTVTVERLLRPDRFGLWFVTTFDQELPLHAANDLVERFLAARIDSFPVDSLISPETEEIYDIGEAGLSLYGGAPGPFVGFDIVARDPAGEDTYLYLVRLRREDGVVAESLLVGPGVDTAGNPRPVLILSVSRVEFQELDESPKPSPAAGP